MSEKKNRVDCLIVNSGGKRHKVRAKNFIIAAGGLETTRLLLAAQRKRPDRFGGKDGPLGRYYMGHLSGKIARLVLDRPSDVDSLDYYVDADRNYVRRRLTLSESAQIALRLQNVSFWPDNFPMADPRHHNGIFSIIFLILAFPPLGRWLIAEGIRYLYVGTEPPAYMPHVKNVLGSPARTLIGLLRLVRDRFLASPKKPGVFLRNEIGEYALHYHAEQQPNPESRVTLLEEVCSTGLPKLRIDLRFQNADADSVLRAHDILDRALRDSGKGKLQYLFPPEKRRWAILQQAIDGFHQMGTTRMGQDPLTSVVDSNCKLHDMHNCFVASTSVFPTGGQANPTLAATALGMRLARYIADTRQCAKPIH
jgi:GMC oxidoreductase